MLDLFTGSRSTLCDGMHRRDFLRLGTLGLGGLTLADLLRASASAGGQASYVKDRAIVLLFLAGGPSQHETFDPKPDGPEGSTSVAGHIATALPGVRFASYLPRLARLAGRLTVVRSFQTNHAEHNGAHKQILTGDLTVMDGKLDKNLGRHHWPRLCPLVFAGGGLKHGQVVGQSDRRGGEPAGNPITIHDFQVTLLHAMVDVGRMRLDPSLPGNLLDRAQRGRPIRELF
jgi:hypothetical protein